MCVVYCGFGIDISTHTCEEMVNTIGGCSIHFKTSNKIGGYPFTIRKIANYRKQNLDQINILGKRFSEPCNKCDLKELCDIGFPKRRWFKKKEKWDKDHIELY